MEVVDHFVRKLTIFDLEMTFYHWFMTLWPFGLCESIFLTTCAYFRIKIRIKHSRKFVNCSIGMFPSIFWPSVPRVLLYQVPSSIFMTKYSRSWQPGWMLAAQNIWGCNRPEYGGLKKIKWLKVESLKSFLFLDKPFTAFETLKGEWFVTSFLETHYES